MGVGVGSTVGTSVYVAVGGAERVGVALVIGRWYYRTRNEHTCDEGNEHLARGVRL